MGGFVSLFGLIGGLEVICFSYLGYDGGANVVDCLAFLLGVVPG